MNAEQQAKAAQVAELLDSDDDLWEFVADVMDASRDKGPRVRDEESNDPIDRDSSYVLEDIIAALRADT